MKAEQEAPSEIILIEKKRERTVSKYSQRVSGRRFAIVQELHAHGLRDISSSRRKNQSQNHQENYHDEKGQQVKPAKQWNLGNIVSMLRKLGNISYEHKMFLTFFVSRANLCPQEMLHARANVETFVSATMCPRLPWPMPKCIAPLTTILGHFFA